jgi:hypothetical protein
LRVQLRALCLLGRCSTTSAVPPAPLALVIFEIGSCFMSWPVWTIIFLFVLPHVAGITGTYHHAQPLVEVDMDSLKFFAQAGEP